MNIKGDFFVYNRKPEGVLNSVRHKLMTVMLQLQKYIWCASLENLLAHGQMKKLKFGAKLHNI
jgi:hypothetical protein